MGAGIAQVAAQAGHPVLLFDAAAGAAEAGRQRIDKALAGLAARNKIDCDEATAAAARINAVDAIDRLSGCGLVIEAIVEELSVKRDLVATLEALLAEDAIIATNTSSISITSIARDAARPGRIAGLHFFNPAPVMRLVEIVSGVATEPDIAKTLFATAQAWGKIPVFARSTPGFIVNRVARPYYAEALRLFEEQVATPATIDAILTRSAGFRMGPFELMDLIGHDVNYAVSRSVFDAFYQDPRFRPSLVQLELVNAGRLGRKSGRGFFSYADEGAKDAPDTEVAIEPSDTLATYQSGHDALIDGVAIVRSDGRRAAEMARDGTPTLVCDLAEPGATRLAFSVSADVPQQFIDRFVSSLAARGVATTRLPDWPGLVAMRTVAMLANEAFEAVLQGVASDQGVDEAMRFGVNYPKGPIAWAREIGLETILAVLDNIHAATGDPRYRASFGLRVAVQETAWRR